MSEPFSCVDLVRYDVTRGTETKPYGRSYQTGISGIRSALRLLRNLFGDNSKRSAALLRMTRSKDLFQPDTTTGIDRYPFIFDFVRTTLGDGPDRRLLSFGCSNGEEVFSLFRRFPLAGLIKGIDINPACIRRARKAATALDGGSHLVFEQAASADQELTGSFDAVFAMAVFRHCDIGDAVRCDHLLRFDDFERSVEGLVRTLKPGGLFAIRNAAFRFTDTAAAADFVPVFFVGDKKPAPNNPLFGRDNLRLPAALRDDGVYAKRDAGP